MRKQGLTTYSIDDIADKHIGKPGTVKRESFENELRLGLLRGQSDKYI